MQKFFTIFASPEVKNRSNTSITYQQTENGQKTEKIFAAPSAGHLHLLFPGSGRRIHPQLRAPRVVESGDRLAGCVRRHSDAGKTRYRATHLLFGGPVANAQSDETLFPIETGHASISTEAEYTGVNIYVKTDENSDPTVVRTLNRINYILLLSIPALLAKLSILILVALIINILRKSVRDEQPLPGRIIIYTRAVGFLLILAEVCTGVGSYIYQSTTRTFLEDSPLQVAASFPLNYWNIVMAILVLFSAEVFSIGSRLSRRAKTHDLKKK